jgi:hypothetical protein
MDIPYSRWIRRTAQSFIAARHDANSQTRPGAHEPVQKLYVRIGRNAVPDPVTQQSSPTFPRLPRQTEPDRLRGAALVAATDPRVKVEAVVSPRWQPDLASRSLANMTAPTLLIVGGNDQMVYELNRRAQALMGGPRELRVVRQATQLGARLVHRPLVSCTRK